MEEQGTVIFNSRPSFVSNPLQYPLSHSYFLTLIIVTLKVVPYDILIMVRSLEDFLTL